MQVYEIILIVIACLTFLVGTLIPFILTIKNKTAALKEAKTVAEKTAIVNEIIGEAQTLIINAENMYKSVDALLKQQGGTSGALKKSQVMTGIQQLCLSKGIDFDVDFWSAEVEKLVTLTKQVNTNAKPTTTARTVTPATTTVKVY